MMTDFCEDRQSRRAFQLHFELLSLSMRARECVSLYYVFEPRNEYSRFILLLRVFALLVHARGIYTENYLRESQAT